ncbi:putative cytochrome-b5 reductase [Microsporum canis]
MGWVGIGALIASISYILYKHPPTSWSFFLSTWNYFTRRRISSDKAKPGLAPTGTSPRSDQFDKELGKSDISLVDSAPGEGTLDADTTPKANPVIPASVIPPITLDELPSTSEHGTEAFTSPSSGPTIGLDAQTKPISNPGLQVPPSPTMTFDPPAPVIEAQEQCLSTSTRTSLMPPPPPPPAPRASPRASLRPPPSAAASLRVPPGSRLTTSTLPVLPLPGKPQRSSRPVILEPGHSPLDWAALTSNPRNNLRGANLPPTLIRVTPSMLKQYNGRKGRDAWTSYQGKVYNITPFVPFHPGGKGELLRGAGKDSEKLFAEIHPWVNWDGMLAECMVGILVSEHVASDKQDGKLDEMD